jgi:Ca-activated chloride channel family protein
VKFAEPFWLILLALPPVLVVLSLVMQRLRRKQWAAFIAPRLRGALLKRSSPLPRWLSLVFLLAACISITLAIARPQGDAGTRTEKSLGRNVLIALDLSRSMRVNDVKPDRLGRAKMIIFELMEAMPNERFGIIGFAGSAYTYAPLTTDHVAVRETVEQINETWAPTGGSDLGAAIRLAIQTLKETGQKNNALVILSDGEIHDNRHADLLIEARESGVYILAVGIGTEDGDYVPNPDFPSGRMVDRSGQPVISRLHPDVLQQLATETKGRYALATSGSDITSMIKSAVNDLDAFEIKGRERSYAIEFYQWFLFPGLAFLVTSIVAATRWRGVNMLTMALSFMILLCPSVRADEVSAAKNALEKGNYKEAQFRYQKLATDARLKTNRARFHLGEGLAAYGAQDFRVARKSFSQSLQAGSPEILGAVHHQLARTLFQLGWQSLSGSSYPEPPSAPPEPEVFDQLVRKKIEEMRNSEESSSTGQPIQNLILNWTDSVRHFESALTHNSTESSVIQNRELVMTYLKRLEQLLKEDREQTEQSMPQPQEPPPQSGSEEEDPEKKKSGQSQEDGTDPGDENKQGEQQEKEPSDGQGDENKKPEQPGKKEPKDDPSGKDAKPDESPEERARRILKENADLEKGPLTPGRREFSPPEKDW